MALLLNHVSNSIWHAFSALATSKDATVQKSKLKVLTANIGTLLDFHDVEKGLDDFRSTRYLDFEHFKYYLHRELFSSLPDTLDKQTLNKYQEKIDEICWFVCRKNIIERDNPVFEEDSVYQLFRVFCLLAEQVTESENIFQVVMSASEVQIVACEFVISLGQEWDSEDFEGLAAVIESFKFPIFLAVIESKYTQGVEKEALQEAIKEIYDMFVQDVLKKGPLLKKGEIIPTFREHWFVLQPAGLTYYASREEKDKRGFVPLSPNSRVEVVQNSPGAKMHRIVVLTDDRVVELGTCDHRSKLQWTSALRTATIHSFDLSGYQRYLALRRRQSRECERNRLCAETREAEVARAQLAEERRAREEAEKRAGELAKKGEEEGRRRRDLEEIRGRLETLLAEEQRAKRDEEIVRNLQARVLREEWEKREELESLQEEQRRLLEEERQKREEFERIQKEKELQLQDAEKKLRKLEQDRERLDEELKLAQEKIMTSERSKEVLETKLRVRERDQVMVQSTREKQSSLIPVRSASMRERCRPPHEDAVNNNNSSEG